MARMPLPLPTSTALTVSAGSSVASISRQPRVVACVPVPKARPASILSGSSPAGMPSAMCEGWTQNGPTAKGRNERWFSATQSVSGSSSQRGSGASPSAALTFSLAPHRRSRCTTARRARLRGWSRRSRPRSDVPAPLPKADARSPGPRTTPSRCSRRLDEAVQDLLRAGFLELDVELVAVDREDAAIAELLVEDPLADAEIDLVALDGAAVVERLVAPARAPARGDAQALIVEAARLLAQAAVMAGGIGGVEAGVAALGQLARSAARAGSATGSRPATG